MGDQSTTYNSHQCDGNLMSLLFPTAAFFGAVTALTTLRFMITG
ncbi:MAG: hypothetical protein WCO71_00555 [Pseudomonadota bacterium]